MANFSIVTNIPAVNAQNQLNKTAAGLQTTINRLSSGLRINQAKDDAAGLAIAENLRADVAALNQAVRNANDGVGIINVADAALNEVNNLLQRAMTLAEQSSSGTTSSRTALNTEYQSILSEINRIGQTVSFNGVYLFQAATTVDVQVGATGTANDRIQVTTGALTSTGLGLTGNLSSAGSAQTELGVIKSAIGTVSGDRGNLGAQQNRLEHTIAVIAAQSENLKAAESQIRDANIAEEIANLTRFQVLNQTGLSALAQANVSQQAVLALLR